jgi:hypothetical protein
MAKGRPAVTRKGRGGGNGPLWIVAGSVVAVLVLGLSTLVGGQSIHPEPRAGVHAGDVVSPERYAAFPRVQAAYQKVAAIPQVIDGLYCHCDCEGHSGHYSLLDCFRDDHAAHCDVCMAEAELAYGMTSQGRTLDEIRAAIDGFYGT